MKPTDLTDHPEGGRYREVFRSDKKALARDGKVKSALTHIYFELQPGEVSHFHKVSSDEVWNLYRGAGIKLYTWDGTDTPPQCVTLSAAGERFCHVVPADSWQAAEPLEGTVLVGCSVAPGFEFDDFTLIDPGSDEAQQLRAADPALARLILP